MKKNLNKNTSDILIDELQKKVLNSPSLKKHLQESEKIISKLQLPSFFASK